MLYFGGLVCSITILELKKFNSSAFNIKEVIK